MRLLTLIGGLLGAVLAAWLLRRFGFDHVLALLEQAGWGILLVICLRPVQMLFSAISWRALAGRTPPLPSLPMFLLLRAIREGVNNLLPVAQVGGEFVGARLLTRLGLPLVRSIACTICDLTAEMVTQVLFTVIGLLTLLSLLGSNQVTDEVIGGLGLACAVALSFVIAQWLGLASLVERGLIRLAARFGWSGISDLGGLHQAITGCYRSPRKMGVALVSQMVSWLLGSIEICIALHFLGHDVSLGAGLVIESLSQAAKSAGFAVPGALGVSEGAFIIVGGLFGLSPQMSIALALIKRLREIALGLPALAAWQWLEHRVGRAALRQEQSDAVPRGGR